MKHFNPSISENAARIFNSKQGDFIGDEVSGLFAIVPVVDICKIAKTTNATNATSATVFTTPTDKDFYLVAATLSVAKDANATSASTTLRVFIDGVSVDIMVIGGITLTAQSATISQTWPAHLKLDRGTTIRIINSAAVATIFSAAAIQGYTVETTKGV